MLLWSAALMLPAMDGCGMRARAVASEDAQRVRPVRSSDIAKARNNITVPHVHGHKHLRAHSILAYHITLAIVYSASDFLSHI